MAIILLMQLSDWFYSLRHSKITQKRIEQFYYDKSMVKFSKSCDVHMFWALAVAFLSQKGGQKNSRLSGYLN